MNLPHWPKGLTGLCVIFTFFLNLCVARKLGGKADFVSYHDEVEGEFLLKQAHYEDNIMCLLNNLPVCVCFCVAEGKPPAAPTGIHASETDRTYVVLSWKAPAYSSKAPMWYYIEKVLSPMLPRVLHCILLGSRLHQLKNACSYIEYLYTVYAAMYLSAVCANAMVLLGWEV